MSEPPPKLRVVDDESEKKDGVVRLRAPGTSFESIEPVARLTPQESPQEMPERLESLVRENFEGRSQEPGVESILDQEEIVENVEQPWGVSDGRLAGVPYGWFVLILVAVIAAGVWSVIAMQRGEKQVERAMQEVRALDQDDQADQRAAAHLVDSVERVVRDYLAADTVEEILPQVRHPQRVKPLIEAEWKVRPPVPLRFSRMTMFQPTGIPDATFWVVRAEVREGEPQNMLVEQLSDTEVRVDWESHVCYQPMNWDDYIAGHPADQALDFRVWVEPDTHYSHEFSNTGRWRAYRLTAKGSDDHLFGYAAADSEEARALDAYSQASGGKATCILRLRFPTGGNSPRGVVIEKLVEPRWLRVVDPGPVAP